MRFILIVLLAAGTVAGFTHGVRSLRGGHHSCDCPAARGPAAPVPAPTAPTAPPAPTGGAGPG